MKLSYITMLLYMLEKITEELLHNYIINYITMFLILCKIDSALFECLLSVKLLSAYIWVSKLAPHTLYFCL